jgi:deazaflavin-dependent oxidoreductase (nitroreductase family)
MTGEPNSNYLYLTTTGRRSGLPREIEIWYTQRQGRYYVIAEYTNSHWVQNLLADSKVSLRVGELRIPARARAVNPSAEPQLHNVVQELSRKKYGWGDGQIVELIPEPVES